MGREGVVEEAVSVQFTLESFRTWRKLYSRQGETRKDETPGLFPAAFRNYCFLAKFTTTGNLIV